MVFVTGFLLADMLVVLVALLYTLYWHQTKNFDYWKKRGVPYARPHWFFGNIGHQVLQRKTCTDFAKNLYKKFKGNGFGGLFIFRRPAIFICDPELIEKVLTRDFSHFEDRSVACNPEETLSDTLYNASGDQWRKMRHNLIPAFSAGKVKGMFDQIEKCAEFLLREIEERSDKSGPVELEPLAFVFATEVIASCAFGVQLMTDPSEGKKFRKAVDLISESSPSQLMKIFFGVVYPKLFRRLGIRIYQKHVTDFFIDLTKETIKYREQYNIQRNDFLQMMLTLKEQEEKGKEDVVLDNSGEEDKVLNQLHHIPLHGKPLGQERCFTENTIPSLIFNFLSAGIKPVVSTITFTMFELAKNPNIQKRLQEEVDSCIANHGTFNYQAVKDMTYLDQIIQEIERLYTYKKVLSRLVTEPYQLPGTDLTLEKGTVVYIPIAAIHKDPQYYPAPEQFNPDRFAGNNFKPNIAFMPYGHGPRICLGIRFAVLMMKVCVARIMAKYTVRLEMEEEIRWDRKVFSPEPIDGLWLSFHKR